MARLAPKGEEAKYFGLFALSGKATAFLGPALVAITTDVIGSQRAGLASLLLLFVVGALVMWRVPEIQKSAMVR
jgi:UMF1 family MFS transporter